MSEFNIKLDDPKHCESLQKNPFRKLDSFSFSKDTNVRYAESSKGHSNKGNYDTHSYKLKGQSPSTNKQERLEKRFPADHKKFIQQKLARASQQQRKNASKTQPTSQDKATPKSQDFLCGGSGHNTSVLMEIPSDPRLEKVFSSDESYTETEGFQELAGIDTGNLANFDFFSLPNPKEPLYYENINLPSAKTGLESLNQKNKSVLKELRRNVFIYHAETNHISQNKNYINGVVCDDRDYIENYCESMVTFMQDQKSAYLAEMNQIQSGVMSEMSKLEDSMHLGVKKCVNLCEKMRELCRRVDRLIKNKQDFSPQEFNRKVVKYNQASLKLQSQKVKNENFLTAAKVWPKKFGGYIDTINQKKILFMNNMEQKLTAKAHREDFFVRKTPTSQSVTNSEYLFKKSY